MNMKGTVTETKSDNRALGWIAGVICLVGLFTAGPLGSVTHPTPQVAPSAAYVAGHSDGVYMNKHGATLPPMEGLAALSQVRFPSSDSDQLQYRLGYRNGFSEGR